MAAPHSFWVIVDGTTPTAFRARQREDLVPTLKQLQRTQPAVVLMWFDRGQLWESPIAAREALKMKRRLRSDRGPGWRPGGSHVDPRERYKLTRDQKRARFKRRRFGKPGSLEARKPGSSGAEKPGSWGASKPGGWGASKPGSWGTRKPGSWRAGKPGSSKSGKPGVGRPFRAGSRRPRGPKRDR